MNNKFKKGQRVMYGRIKGTVDEVRPNPIEQLSSVIILWDDAGGELCEHFSECFDEITIIND